MKKVTLPPLNNNKTFNFHEGGQDAQFDNAMAKLDIMYDDIFKSQVQLDSIFQNLKVDNNPILEPVSDMFREVFDPKIVQDQKQYIKLSSSQAEKYKKAQNGLNGSQSVDEEDSELVIGEPVYIEKSYDWNHKL